MPKDNYETISVSSHGEVLPVTCLVARILSSSDESAKFYEEVATALNSADKSRVVIDLSNVTWGGSSFLATVVMGWKVMHDKGGTVKLCGLSGLIREQLERAKFLTFINAYESVEEAVQGFAE